MIRVADFRTLRLQDFESETDSTLATLKAQVTCPVTRFVMANWDAVIDVTDTRHKLLEVVTTPYNFSDEPFKAVEDLLDFVGHEIFDDGSPRFVFMERQEPSAEALEGLSKVDALFLRRRAPWKFVERDDSKNQLIALIRDCSVDILGSVPVTEDNIAEIVTISKARRARSTVSLNQIRVQEGKEPIPQRDSEAQQFFNACLAEWSA